MLTYIIKQSSEGKSIRPSKLYNVIFYSIIYCIIAFIAKYCLAIIIPDNILQDILLPAILYLIEIIGYEPAHAMSNPQESSSQKYEDQEVAGPEYEVNYSDMQDKLDKFDEAIEAVEDKKDSSDDEALKKANTFVNSEREWINDLNSKNDVNLKNSEADKVREHIDTIDTTYNEFKDKVGYESENE